MNVDPSRGIGRALFTALTQLGQSSNHQELVSAKLILLGFSGTGSLVGGSGGVCAKAGSGGRFHQPRTF